MKTELLFLAVQPDQLDKIVEIGRAATDRQIAVILTGAGLGDNRASLAAAIPGAQHLATPVAADQLACVLKAVR